VFYMTGLDNLPTLLKNDFVKGVEKNIAVMRSTQRTFCSEYKIKCLSKYSDVDFEYWDIIFEYINRSKFKTHVTLWVKWKNGKWCNIKMPTPLWDSKKEFLAFAKRECDK
jgi:hypothetical protein